LEAKRLDAGAQQAETSAKMRETDSDVKNKEAEDKCDDMQVNF
jgi:hypothetical protein